MGNNGRAPSSQFPGANVPIVGQPFEVVGFLVSVVVLCRCEGRRSLLVTSNQVTQCPACKKGYVVHAVNWQKDQPPAFRLAIVVPEEDVSETPALVP